MGHFDLAAHYRTWRPVEYPWAGCEYPDPLVVYPPSAAVAELDEFLGDREERMRCDFPYVVPIAPDDVHKDNVSGGMWYNLSVPAVADDTPLNDEWHQTTFVNYLELAVRWGGFPGSNDAQGIDDQFASWSAVRRAKDNLPLHWTAAAGPVL